MNVTRFSDWKSGRGRPSAEAVRSISEYFGISSDYLLGMSDVPYYVSTMELDDGDVIKIYRTKKDPLTQEQREEIIAVLNSSEGIIRPYDKPEGESLDEYVRRIAREELDKHGKD